MENVPFAPATLLCATNVSGLSTSVTVSTPDVVKGELVSASDTVAELTTAASLVPLIVTCTVLVVPSAAATVNVSDTDWPTLRLSNALLAVYVHAPLAAIENVPFVPATLVCGTNVCALSTSLTVSVPPVVRAALVSARATVAELRTAASLVPLIVTCTVLVVPSAAATVNVSDTDWPTLRLSNALLAVYLQAPLAAIENVPFVPATLVCGTNVCALSTSLTVSVPPVVRAALVSARATVAELRTAASLVPLIVTCTLLVVPSAAATVKLSDTDWPTFRLSNALFAV